MASLLEQDGPELGVRRGHVGLELQGLAQHSLGLIAAPLPAQGQAEIQSGRDVVGLEAQGLATGRLGVGVPALADRGLGPLAPRLEALHR